jgi:outer membrane protein
MRLVQRCKVAAVAAALLSMGSSARAESDGRLYLAAGWLHLSPQSASGPLTLTNFGGRPIDLPIPRTGAGVDNADTLGFSIGYFATAHIAVQADIGVPPLFALSGTDALARFGKLGEARQWSPALIFKYYFRNPGDALRPYLGIGVSRVWFTNTKITSGAFITETLGGGTNVDIDSVWAPVFQAGLTYNIDRHWFATVALSMLPMSTDATLHTRIGAQEGPLTATTRIHMRLNPIVSYANVGYRF